MNTLTYKQAYDKIIEAYFKDEIQPYCIDFCFCGTLGYDENNETSFRGWDYKLYTISEYLEMEAALLIPIRDKTTKEYKNDIYVQDVEARDRITNHKNYENALFAGMSAALDVLKKIHIERGEVIDEVLVFNKRKLIDAI